MYMRREDDQWDDNLLCNGSVTTSNITSGHPYYLRPKYAVEVMEIRFTFEGKMYWTNKAVVSTASKEERKAIAAEAFAELVKEVFANL